MRGSKKQRLKLWQSQEIQKIVTDKAHRLGMHISRVCAWGTSRLAYDGKRHRTAWTKSRIPDIRTLPVPERQDL
ncbi:MAG: hypothetical protein ACLTX3_07575 [Lachnospiraceae bacterium]